MGYGLLITWASGFWVANSRKPTLWLKISKRFEGLWDMRRMGPDLASTQPAYQKDSYPGLRQNFCPEN